MLQKPTHTKIILSGVEGDRFMETAYHQARCRDMLCSFLYLHNKGSQWFNSRCKSYSDVRWMIDSGAHSFRKEGYCAKWPDLAWFEDFALKYRDWALKNKDNISLLVNLDVDTPCGMENMLRWDEEIFRPLERQGLPVCYVWHEAYGFDVWLKMCREHEYVGLPGHLEEAVFHRMLKPAMMNGCRVHGFACTKSYVLGKMPFASVDSTSWKAGERYGQTFVFEGGKLRTFDKNHKADRKPYKARWVSMGVDWDGLEKDKAEEVTKVCAIAWGDCQDFVKTMSGKLAYWLKTSKLLDEYAPSAAKVSAEGLTELLQGISFPVMPASVKEARTMFSVFRGFLARDPEVVMTLADDELERWISSIGAAPENDSRCEKEACFRQKLYEWFYKLEVSAAQGRSTPDEVADCKMLIMRKEALTEFPGVEIDLPDNLEYELRDDSFLLEFEGKTSAEGTPDVQSIGNASEGSKPTEDEPLPTAESVQVDVTTKFLDSIEDRVQRSRAGLGLELLIEQFKLKHRADSYERLKMCHREMKRCRQEARKLADEITTHLDLLPETVQEGVRNAAEEAFTRWRDFDADAEIARRASQRSRLAQRPQNQLMAAKASEIGRLGGAPRGNQNARKHGLTSKLMPNLACDNCPHVQVCPKYRAGHVCAFLNEFDRELQGAENDNPEMTAVRNVLVEQVKRARRALLFETFEGGILNKEASKVMRDVVSAAHILHMMKNPGSGFGNAPAVVPQKAGGVLDSIFGGMVKPVDATVVKEAVGESK